MTIIAYRDGVMAADSLVTGNGTILGHGKKIAKGPDGSLYAAGGHSVDCAAWLRWCEAGQPEGKEPKLRDFTGLMVTPEGAVRICDESLNWYERTAAFHAIGSGTDLALGAMAFGASAIEAVGIAIMLEAHCGGPIQAERLG